MSPACLDEHIYHFLQYNLNFFKRETFDHKRITVFEKNVRDGFGPIEVIDL